ncbi:restriction endonuclease subunit S domain-containing protein [Streptomyces europaeiscabiei]|uniref:hypothetical protein n=1 Tax=Streptomyces europaeiscabiei TaxID=146819 RepID=UPI0013C4B5AF|nr:hypothetical protein [Streptomyces europaeiscabiei]MDX3713065.1 hypothetical protein [Streptomyces europaeiscabiei]MDX3846161.1 hypothetical protein [Streptomyces europaeiscabiei]MDX3865772.1 hypothetical protein [Streptomyces europaeiscabiei]MDX3874614.1 hypothetical protein [Streptomyces europaeiscabiei]
MGDEQATERSMVPLKDVLRRVETGWSPVCEPRLPAADEWGVLKLSAVTSGRFVAAEAKALPKGVAPRPRLEVKPGDVLVSRANGVKALVGVVCPVGDVRPGLMVPDLVFRLVADPEVLDPRYLAIALASGGLRSQVDEVMRGSSGQYKISQADVRTLRVPRLALDQQRRIVAAHDAFERRIGALESMAAKKALLLDALIEQLVSFGKEDLVPLEDAGVAIDAGVTLGAHRVPHLRPTGYLRVANVRKGWIEGDIARLEAMERDHRRYSLTPGDLLVVEGHADPEQIGRCAMVGPEQSGLLYQNHLFRLRFDDALPEFAMLWLNSRAVRVYWKSRTATSSGLYTINSRLLEAVPFPRASRDTQDRVVGVWKAESRTLSLMRQRIAKLRLIQRAAIEDLLVGRKGVSAT